MPPLLYKTLRFLERYTKTDMIYLAKGGFWLSAGQVITSLSSFVLAIAFANLMPPESYGVYRYVISWVSMLAAVTLIGANTALIQAISRGFEGSFWKIFWIKTYAGFIGAVISFSIAGYYYLQGNIILSISFILVGLLLPTLKASGLYLSLLYGRKDFKLAAISTSVVRIISAGVMIGTLFFTDNLFIILLAFFIPETILQFFYIWHTLRKRPLSKEIDPTTTSYGVHLSIMEILKVAAGQIDKFIIFHYLGATQLAIYTFALATPNQIKSFLQNITSLALPKMSMADDEVLRTHLPKKILRLELLMTAVTILYILAAPFLYKIFFPQYIASIAFSQIAALSLLFLPRTFLSSALVAKQKQKELYHIRIWTPMMRIIILCTTGYFWGIWGILWGKLFGDAIQLWIYQYFFRRAFKTPPEISTH